MAASRVTGARLAGIASAVPRNVADIAPMLEMYGADKVRQIQDSTGIKQRRKAVGGVICSDLCYAAAEKLLAELGWERESIDGLIFISQTPDYPLPATACVLQHRLGLAKKCAAFDVNLGCSGYVYGLWLASHLLSGGALKRVLLLVGDCATAGVSPLDRSVNMLFGDAGTATALEADREAGEMVFELGTDGAGYRHLIIPAGAFRERPVGAATVPTERENGNIRSDWDVFMDGGEIFVFTLREVPPLIRSVMSATGWTMADPDAVVFHQANRMMLQHLAKSLKIPAEKFPLSLEQYGNTSSASIPLTLSAQRRERMTAGPAKLLLAGFGVGLSWAAVTLTCGPLVMPEMIEVDAPAAEPEPQAQAVC